MFKSAKQDKFGVNFSTRFIYTVERELVAE